MLRAQRWTKAMLCASSGVSAVMTGKDYPIYDATPGYKQSMKHLAPLYMSVQSTYAYFV